jgi:hypothetical protein
VRLFARHNLDARLVTPDGAMLPLHTPVSLCCGLQLLCSPNKDFGRPNKPFRKRFRRTFQRFVAKVVYSPAVINESPFSTISIFSVNLDSWLTLENPNLSLSFPNEDLGRMDKRGNLDFEGRIFKGVSTRFGLLSIESISKIWIFIFCLSFPKSSFGRHIVIEFASLRFFHFRPRPENETFCSPYRL